MVYKCKICGGNLEIEKNQKIATCEYCGIKQTLPKNENNKITNLYDRANHFLRNNEYDKAEVIYETILNEDMTDGEAYWSIVLCKYGVQYVKDPKTGQYIPTCNRTKTTSIFADEDYKQALENSQEEQKELYKKQANQINEIQRRIVELASKEEKYDVFICYKEKDKNGQRTQDSVLAQDIYTRLIDEGLKVFFARITLEDKIGIEYEPYIFAALNSAKVMIVLGTNKENFESPWVRNEWSRYLSLIKENKNKNLIPCYKDMDAYDLPEEFAHLQAQDMGKIGFMQDLIRGIKKLTIDNQEEKNSSIKIILSNEEKQEIYKRSKKDMDVTLETKVLSHREKTKIFHDLQKNFEKLGEYLDAVQLAKKCNYLYIQEKRQKLILNIKIFGILTIIIAIIGTILMTTYIIPNSKYSKALEKYNSNQYYSAIKEFNKIEKYKDSKEILEKAKIEWKKSNTSIVAGKYDRIYAVKSIGTVYNLSSVFNDYSHITEIESVEDNVFLLKEDGTVEKSLKEEGYENITDDWTNIVNIKATNEYIFGLKSNGTVLNARYKKDKYSTNENINIDTSSWSEIVQIVPCLGGIVGLREDGTLVQSEVKYGSIAKIYEWKDIVQLTGSRNFLIGLKEDGTLVGTWADNFRDIDIEKESNVIQLSSNYYYSNHIAFIRKDGTARAIGSNNEGQCNISSIDDIVFLYAGDKYTIGISKDKKIIIKGQYDDKNYNQSISKWTDIKTYKEWRSIKNEYRRENKKETK